MSKADMEAAGRWNLPMLESMTSPCSTKREAIWVKITEYMIVQSQTGSIRMMHLASSTWVMVQRRHGFGGPRRSSSVITDALSRHLKDFQRKSRFTTSPVNLHMLSYM